jgi:hypothetical protein
MKPIERINTTKKGVALTNRVCSNIRLYHRVTGIKNKNYLFPINKRFINTYAHIVYTII